MVLMRDRQQAVLEVVEDMLSIGSMPPVRMVDIRVGLIRALARAFALIAIAEIICCSYAIPFLVLICMGIETRTNVVRAVLHLVLDIGGVLDQILQPTVIDRDDRREAVVLAILGDGVERDDIHGGDDRLGVDRLPRPLLHVDGDGFDLVGDAGFVQITVVTEEGEVTGLHLAEVRDLGVFREIDRGSWFIGYLLTIQTNDGEAICGTSPPIVNGGSMDAGYMG